MTSDSPQPPTRPPHALALELLRRFQDRSGATILEIGRGSGRNTAALLAAGFHVTGLDEPASADAALSTHALLHGTREDVAQLLGRIAGRLVPGAPLFGTFGSLRDARYGEGTRIGQDCYAPTFGDEKGVPHAFFDEPSLRALFDDAWTIESLREVCVDTLAGEWAHAKRPLEGAYHWFVVATRRAQ